MKTSVSKLVLCSVAASGVLMLGACGNSSPSDEGAASPASSATAQTAPPPMGESKPSMSSSTSNMPANSGSSMMSPPASSTSSMPSPSGSSMPASSSTSASTASPDSAGAFAVGEVTVGDSLSHQKVKKAASVIAPDKNSIYASVDTTGNTKGATLSARWSYVNGKDKLVSAISQAIATTGPATTTFTIKNPNAWPEGTYKVDIAVDGKPVSSKRFEVKAPA